MQEFWFCQACKSMNRAGADRCYSCHAPREQVVMATLATRQPGVVLTPGLDEEHRQVAWALMARQPYVSAWRLGYVAAAMLSGFIALGAAAILAELAAMFANRSPIPVYPAIEPGTPWLPVLLAIGLYVLATVVVHSAFLGLASMDSGALGSGSPRFHPVRACAWWIESALWSIRAGLAFVGPPLLCLGAISFGGVLTGLPMGVIWFMCAFWLLGDPVANLAKPARLLRDLWERLAVPGDEDPRQVSLWSAAWGTARGFDFAIAGAIFLVVVAVMIMNAFGAGYGISFGNSSLDDWTLTLVVLVDLGFIVQWVADLVAMYLLVRITMEIARRQRVREAWVLGGLEDSNPDAPLNPSAAGLGRTES